MGAYHERTRAAQGPRGRSLAPTSSGDTQPHHMSSQPEPGTWRRWRSPPGPEGLQPAHISAPRPRARPLQGWPEVGALAPRQREPGREKGRSWELVGGTWGNHTSKTRNTVRSMKLGRTSLFLGGVWQPWECVNRTEWGGSSGGHRPLLSERRVGAGVVPAVRGPHCEVPAGPGPSAPCALLCKMVNTPAFCLAPHSRSLRC